jgi:hypothetical protein
MTTIVGPYNLAPNAANVLLGRGKLYFDPFLPNTITRTGEQDLGNCTSFEVTAKPEVKEKYESMDPASALYQRGVVRNTVTLKIVGDEYTLDNLVTALNGSIEVITAPGATIAAEAITPSGGAILGRYYSLAHRNVTTLTDVKQASTSLVLGTDYTADLLRGRIYLLPTSPTIVPGDPLTADYVYGEYTYNAVAIATQGTVDGFVRYVSNNIKGPNYEGEFWHASFVPSGALAFIADDFGNFTIEGELIADFVNHPTEPLGHLIQTS